MKWRCSSIIKKALNQKWKVRELRRQIKSSLFHRLALSTDKAGVLALARQGHPILTADDIIHDPYVLEFTGLPQKKRYKENDLEKALKDNMEKFLLEAWARIRFHRSPIRDAYRWTAIQGRFGVLPRHIKMLRFD